MNGNDRSPRRPSCGAVQPRADAWPGLAWLVLLLLGAASALIPTAAAADTRKPWTGPAFSASAAELLAAAESAEVSPHEDVLVLYEGGHYVFDSAGRVAMTYRRIYKVYNQRAATNWGSMTTGWAPWYEERPTLRARVLTPDGRFHRFDPKTLSETSAGDSPHIYSDYRSLTAPLPAMTAGSIVEVVLVHEERELYFDQGKVYPFYFGAGFPVAFTEVVVEAPRGLRLRFKTHDLPKLVEKRSRAGKRTRWVFRHGPMEARGPVESSMPSDLARVPTLVFSPARSWQKLAASYHGVVEAQIAKGGIDAIPFQVAGQDRERDEIVREALAFVHANVRYSGLEFGRSALVPWTPSQTWKRRYGDCKDQATLLVALLRRAGVRAHVALLAAGTGQDIEPSMPSASQFNHAIVYVPGERPLWIDPTDEYARAGELPITDAGRWALIAAPETRRLVRTPAARAKDNKLVETREIFLADHGGARVVETSRPTGSFERSYRSTYHDATPDKTHENLSEYMRSEYRVKGEVEYKTSPTRDMTQPFELRIEAKDARRAWTDETQATVYLFPTNLLRALPRELLQADADQGQATDTRPRAHDFAMSRPYIAEERYIIHIPAGFRLRRLPEAEKLSLGRARLTTAYRQTGDTVFATLCFDSGPSRLTPAEFEAMRTALAEFRKREAIELTFEHIGLTRLYNGESVEGLEDMKRLAERMPKNPVHRARLAQGYLDVGMGQTARVHGKRAVELDPDSEYAQITYGWILSHDVLGRRFHPGFDRDGSAAAYRKAVAISPESTGLRGNLAQILEHDEHGTRYGPGADLDGAIEVYRTLRADTDSQQYNDAFLTALFKARRYDELLATAATMQNRSDTAHGYMVAALAIAQDAGRAIDKSATLASSNDQKRAILDQAIGHLSMARHYPEALALTREAARGARDPAAWKMRQDILARVERHETRKLSAKRPEDLFARMLLFVLEPGTRSTRELRKLFTKRALESSREKELSQATRDIADAMVGARQSPEERKMIIDFALGILDVEVDDAAPWGYRLRATPRIVMANQTMYLYAKRERGSYRILSAEREFGPLGAEALALARRGKLDGARQWLDWARERFDDPRPGDPFSGAPFASLWTQGEPGDRSSISIAAASLMVMDQHAKEAIPVLRDCAEARDSKMIPCQRALVQAHNSLGQMFQQYSIVERMNAQHPDESWVVSWRSLTLQRLGRWAALERYARERVAANPDDEHMKRMVAEALIGANQLEKGYEAYRALASEPTASDGVLNDFAWFSLFTGRATDRSLEAAQRSVQLTKRQESSNLNTLAAVLADRGHLLQAYRVMLESMAVAGATELRPQDWVVFGRIAQGYGLLDVARAAYDRIPPPKELNSPISSHALGAHWRATL